MQRFDFVKWWNTSFPLDFIYRKKYSIGFNSSSHRELNPISVYYEFYEEYLELKQKIDIYEKNRRKTLLEKGNLVDPDFKGVLDIKLDSLDITELMKTL